MWSASFASIIDAVLAMSFLDLFFCILISFVCFVIFILLTRIVALLCCIIVEDILKNKKGKP